MAFQLCLFFLNLLIVVICLAQLFGLKQTLTEIVPENWIIIGLLIFDIFGESVSNSYRNVALTAQCSCSCHIPCKTRCGPSGLSVGGRKE